MAKKLKSKKMKVDPNLVDYYRIFNLNKNASIKELDEALNKELYTLRQKQQVPLSHEHRIQLEDLEKKLRDARRILLDRNKREKYDEQLEYALQNGMLDTTAQKIAEDVYEEIERMFESNDYSGVIRKCQQLLSDNSSESKLYNYIARSYFLLDRPAEAIKTVDDCLNLHPDDASMLQLAARYYNLINEDFGKAQEFINHMFELNASDPDAVCEQCYLYLCMKNIEMAFSTIDEYVSANPTDEYFRAKMALDMVSYTYRLYEEDEEGNSVLLSQEAYETCLAVTEKAASIYKDDDIIDLLEYTRHFGVVEFNKDNREHIFWLWLVGAIYAVAGIASGVTLATESVLACIAAILFVGLLLGGGLIFCGVRLLQVSKRPYWQIYRYEMTGYRDKEEKIYVTIGKVFTGVIRLSIKASWALIKWCIRFALPG